MKAAIITGLNTTPELREINEPNLENDQQQIITVVASPLKNYDRLRTKSGFYGSFKTFPSITGSDGVGTLENGTHVYAQGISGMFAEKAVITKGQYVVLPESLNPALAAALPNAITGSLVPLRLRGYMKKDMTVLINGATGFTGQIAVQAAKYLKAKRIIATGRDQERLNHLKNLGATELILLNQSEEKISGQFKKIQSVAPIDIVLDYLWGHVAELFIRLIKDGPTHQTRFINLGNNAGTDIKLNADTIRSSAIEIIGAGTGSYTKEEYNRIHQEIFPEIFQLAAKGILTANVETAALENIAEVWNRKAEAGRRIVFTMN
mgnify:CR=1 FL=1